MTPRMVWYLRGLPSDSRGKPGGRVGAWGPLVPALVLVPFAAFP